MTNRKNGFWTFVFSLCPGAGEMYMGLYKQGISLMVLFWGLGIICGWAHLELLWFLEPVIWFYSFFHVHNLRGMPLPTRNSAALRTDFSGRTISKQTGTGNLRKRINACLHLC